MSPMEATIKLDDVLDLITEYQQDLAATIDTWQLSATVKSVLWDQYKRSSKLYDDIRRAAK